MQGDQVFARRGMVHAHAAEKGEGLMAPGELERGSFQVCRSGIERAHFKTMCVRRLACMHNAGIDENDATGRGEMPGAAVGEGLDAALDDADYVIVVAVARVGV